MLEPALALVGRAQTSPHRIDHEAARRAVGDLLRALGADDRSDGLRETPRRVADAYAELLTPQPFEATTFPNEDGYDELVIARRRRRAGGRAHVHVAARGLQAGHPDRDVGAARRDPRRRAHPPGVPDPDHEDTP
jgi:hypothetical protein